VTAYERSRCSMDAGAPQQHSRSCWMHPWQALRACWCRKAWHEQATNGSPGCRVVRANEQAVFCTLRTQLLGEVFSGGECVTAHHAFNEAVIDRGPNVNFLQMDAYIDGFYITTIQVRSSVGPSCVPRALPCMRANGTCIAMHAAPVAPVPRPLQHPARSYVVQVAVHACMPVDHMSLVRRQQRTQVTTMPVYTASMVLLQQCRAAEATGLPKSACSAVTRHRACRGMA
jgi:hypothetical protein